MLGPQESKVLRDYLIEDPGETSSVYLYMHGMVIPHVLLDLKLKLLIRPLMLITMLSNNFLINTSVYLYTLCISITNLYNLRK